MKRLFGTALLVCLVALGAFAALDKPPAQKDPAAIPNVDKGDITPRSRATDDKPRTPSPESVEYLQKLRKRTPFGTKDFDLAGLRAGMGSRW